MTDYKWTLNYSLYQLIVFGLVKYVGLWALSVFGAIIWSVLFVWFKKLLKLEVISSLILVIYFWLISLPVLNLGLRPQILSTVFLGLCYVILIKEKWWWLIPLSLVWANTHGAFILEMVLMGIYAIELLIRRDKKIIKFWLVGMATVLVSLINPFGVGIYEEAFRHNWYPLNQLIAEWVAPTGLGIVMILTSISVLGLIIVNLFWFEKQNLFKKKNKVFLILSWLVLLGLGFKARRNLSLVGMSSIFLFTNLVEVKIKDGWWSYLLIICLIGIRLPTIFDDDKINWDLVERRRGYPVGAIEYLMDNDRCQNIYNTYEWGGYLVWKLPDKKFFVDGRMTVWDNIEKKSPYTIYLEIIQARDGWSDRLIGYGTDCLLISKGTFLDLELRDEEKGWQDAWKNVYEDKKTAIYRLI